MGNDLRIQTENKFVEVFSKIMPIAFIPLIGLQVYSIGARIGENGITPVRYMGVMFIIFEIIAIVLSIVNKRKYLTNALLVAAVLMAISTILPVVNMEEISNYNQASRLKMHGEKEKALQVFQVKKSDSLKCL